MTICNFQRKEERIKIKIVIEEDKVLEQKFLQFVQPVIDKLNISYTGFDLFVKDDGDCYLIELNAYPLFKVISEHNYQAAVDVFKKILTLFKSKAENRLI